MPIHTYIYVHVDVSGTKMMIEMFPCPSNRKRLLLAKKTGESECAEKNQEHNREGIQLTNYIEKRSPRHRRQRVAVLIE